MLQHVEVPAVLAVRTVLLCGEAGADDALGVDVRHLHRHVAVCFLQQAPVHLLQATWFRKKKMTSLHSSHLPASQASTHNGFFVSEKVHRSRILFQTVASKLHLVKHTNTNTCTHTHTHTHTHTQTHTLTSVSSGVGSWSNQTFCMFPASRKNWCSRRDRP